MSSDKLTKPPLYGPFKPNSPAKIGYNKTLNPHPQYIEENENWREDPKTLREKIIKK